ncbi:CvpA family protein [Allosphingosinicella deserti]|uniref:Colicin V production protein n=1 Tax=Allosphingosinicella deserti TaxID=2116704 RepID=A0A2P7QP17_9SPHN|nr:CvpA family protein [Sphingomonas deserti]PSJ39713.1 colicin V production protein [Sphingomonas deserti]
MTALDIIVLLLVGGGLVTGWFKGFVGEVLTLAAWIVAIVFLKLLHEPVTNALVGTVGTRSGAAVLAFALVFGITFLIGKLVARQIGGGVKKSVIGPVDRVLGSGFGALKGLIIATLLYLAANLVYDTIWGRESVRPEWMAKSRTYPLLSASGRAIVDFVEWRRGRPVDPKYRQAPANESAAADGQ